MKYETWRDIKTLIYTILIDFSISFALYVILEYVINHKTI